MKYSRVLVAVLSVLLICFSISGQYACADLVATEGILRYYDEMGRQASELGLDVSFYNNQIDWQAVKDQGISFIIVRLGGRGWGTGHLYGDRQTQVFLLGAQDAGLKIGAYFFSTAINITEAIEEAEAALYTLNGFSLDLPIYIDMEWSGDYPNGRADKVSAWTRAAIAEAFCRTIEAAGYQAGIYASEGYMRYETDAETVSYLPVWLASYTVDNLLPEYDGKYDMWQFTDSGYLGGIDGPVDVNMVY